MRRTTRSTTLAIAVAVAAPLTMALTGQGTAAADGAGGGTAIWFTQVLRRCDYSETHYNGPTGYARPTGVIRSDGSTVSADIQIATAIPDTHYDVRLIQMPRPSSASCNGGDPGVAVAALNTDGAGGGATTVSGPIAPGATGAWVFISRPSAFGQDPAEFYTTDFIPKI
jgi:hypothetical protein